MANNEFKYFKKTKMYQLLTMILGEDGLEPMKLASYKFYRGSEWLEVGSIEFNGYYQLSRCKDYISLDVYTHDILSDSYMSVDRKCYKAVNSLSETISCTYSRHNGVF